MPLLALVGYTNAGKSTVFDALTQAGVLESARMFATLDPELRQLQFPSRRKILLSDTLGFVRNLPTLVTSFRASLEEVERAEVLLHVQDAASPIREEQKTQVEKVLAELAVSTKLVIHVLNKVDLIPPRERAHISSYREAIPVSSLQQISSFSAPVDQHPFLTATAVFVRKCDFSERYQTSRPTL